VDTTAGFTYAWSVTKDGNAFASGTGATISFTPDDQGTYVATATATDKDTGTSTAATHTVMVSNVKPVVSFTVPGGAKQESSPIALTSTVTDASSVDQAAGFTYAWTITRSQDGGPFLAYASASTQNYTLNPNDYGVYRVTLTAQDKDGAVSDPAVQDITVAETGPTMALSGNPTTPEGSTYSLTLGPVVDLGAGDHAVASVIDWGDGYSTPFDPWSANRVVTHTYDDGPASFTISVTIWDNDNMDEGWVNAGTLPISVTNVVPTAFVSVPSPVAEGSATTQIYFFGQNDASAADRTAGYVYSYDLNGNGLFDDGYGDGTAAGGIGSASLTIPSSYLSTPGPHPITMRITDKDGGSRDFARTITVTNSVPTVTVGGNASVAEGATFTRSGSFSDPGTETYTATVDYGDGTGTQPLALNPNRTFSLSHVFTVVGTWTVTVSVSDGTGTGSRTFQVTVTNVAPTVSAGSDATLTAGSTLTRSGSFTDPGSETWTATVNYGDGGGNQALSLNPDKTFNLSHLYATPGNYTVTVRVTDSLNATGTASFTAHVLATTFRVLSCTPTPSGFDIAFSGPVKFKDALGRPVLNLYQGYDYMLGPADMIVTDGYGNPLVGSLTWDTSTNTAHFVQTGGVLADGNYTVTLVSGSTGWQDSSGNLLDGNGDGTAGDDYTYTTPQPIAQSSSRVLSLPDFARGAEQALNVAADGTAATSTGGLPIRLSNAGSVLSVDFDLRYDPTLLQIASAELGPDVPAGSWSITTNTTVPGTLHVTISGSVPLSTTTTDWRTVVLVRGDVPATAPYGAAEALKLTNVRVNGGLIASVGDSALHKAVFFGDVSGDGWVDGFDASFISRNTVYLDDGFDFAPLTDPVIVGGVTGLGFLSGLDASFAAQKGVFLDVPQIPDCGSPPAVYATVDPTVQIGAKGMVAKPGDTVHAVMQIKDSSEGVLAGRFTVKYDTRLLDLSAADVRLSTYLSNLGWGMAKNVDDAKGTAWLTVYGTVPLPAGTPQLVDLAFHVPAKSAGGTSPLNLTGALNGGQLIMTPVSGSITVPVAKPQKPKSGPTLPAKTQKLAPKLDKAAAAPAKAAKPAIKAAAVDKHLATQHRESQVQAAQAGDLLAALRGRKQNKGSQTAWDAALLSLLSRPGK
jgi:hypothetical protein